MAGSPDPIDIHVGGKLREIRRINDLSQHDVAYALGVSYQQIQKYERGTNRISASRLYHLTQLLNIPITYFYEDLFQPEELSLEDLMTAKETIELVNCYYRIVNPRIRKLFLSVVRILQK
jgi:transcriptional regulator with XRE-family HTH domain